MLNEAEIRSLIDLEDAASAEGLGSEDGSKVIDRLCEVFGPPLSTERAETHRQAAEAERHWLEYWQKQKALDAKQQAALKWDGEAILRSVTHPFGDP